MIAVYPNVLVYAHGTEAREREATGSIVRTLAQRSRTRAILSPGCYEFLSVATNHRIWKDAATPPERAWRQLKAWTTSPSNRLLGETDDSSTC